VEKDYNDGELCKILNKPLAEIAGRETAGKREILMKHRKEELSKLIAVYYAQRGWSDTGIPKVETIKKIGLWNFLTEETREKIAAMNGQ
jgi:aldehyde:ferredoxin oxidoreductase